MDYIKILAELGFPIAAALAAGYFIFLTLKFILDGVLSSIKGLSNIIVSLDKRVKVMNNDVVKIDALVSSVLGLRPDISRLSRPDQSDDFRQD